MWMGVWKCICLLQMGQCEGGLGGDMVSSGHVVSRGAMDFYGFVFKDNMV